jgi:hypothetical protein
MSDTTSKADSDWQRKLELYPSLKKFDELGKDYVEVRFMTA